MQVNAQFACRNEGSTNIFHVPNLLSVMEDSKFILQFAGVEWTVVDIVTADLRLLGQIYECVSFGISSST